MTDLEKKKGEILPAEEEEPVITMYGVVDEERVTEEMNRDVAPEEPPKSGFAHSLLRLSATLGIIALVVGLLLAGVNALTEDAIAAGKAAKKQQAMQMVQPDADAFEPVPFTPTDLVGEINRVSAAGEPRGYVVTATPLGFGGTIELIVGVDTEGAVTGISIVSLSETPGRGARAKEDAFQGQFAGKSAPIAVVKSGAGEHEINAISAATITSEAVTEGVNAALEAVAALS